MYSIQCFIRILPFLRIGLRPGTCFSSSPTIAQSNHVLTLWSGRAVVLKWKCVLNKFLYSMSSTIPVYFIHAIQDIVYFIWNNVDKTCWKNKLHATGEIKINNHRQWTFDPVDETIRNINFVVSNISSDTISNTSTISLVAFTVTKRYNISAKSTYKREETDTLNFFKRFLFLLKVMISTCNQSNIATVLM